MQLAESNIQNTFSISPFNEYYLPSVNRNMFENIDSKTQFNKRFKADFNLEDKLNIVVGMDSGLLVNYLLDQGIPNGSIFIFIELNAVIDLLKIDIPKDLRDKLFVCTLEEFQQNIPSDTYSLYILKSAFKHHRSIAATNSHLPEYSILNTEVIRILEAEYTVLKLNSSRKKYYEEQFRNISENISPASLLNNLFNGQSCLIIAGGPSLDESIGWIKNNYNNLILIAVSRVAGKLLQEGIIPHIIVSVDPFDFSFEVNRDMMQLAPVSLFVNSYHVNSRLLGQWQGKSLFMDNKYPWQIEPTDNVSTRGPTVTNASVHLATKMGFSQILLTGVDLCFSDNGHTHAKNSVEAKIGPNLGIMGEWIETYSGKKAETVIPLKMAIEALAQEAENSPSIDFINLSSNAAKVPFIYYKKTSDIKLKLINCSPKQLLDLIPTLSNSARKNDILTSRKGCQELSNTLEKIIKLAKTAKNINSKIQNKSRHNAEHSKRLDQIEQQINHKYAHTAKLIKTYGLAEFSTFLTTKKTVDWDEPHMRLMTRKYYEAFINVSERLNLLTKETLRRLNHRLSEITVNTNFSDLAHYWRKEQQHGRVNIWLKNHPHWERYYDNALQIEETQQLLTNLLAEYAEQLTIMPKLYIDTVKKSASMHNVFEKIMVLIRDESYDGLVKMAKNLRLQAANDDYVKVLYHLAFCHQLRLEGNDVEALDTLLALKVELRTEIILKQICTLALKLSQIDLAQSALDSLCQFSDDYTPQHAHILRLQGKYQESLNLYLDYLEKYPEDVSVWLKLGIFMIKVEELDSAKATFQRVLEIDPSNQVALLHLNKLTL
ncbi:DUF115 domain-containing protein [Shewanella gelidimarina]|uniref:6-hydroxymethylpterin diphosphokinase MptE-like protein n=1 Tax=Shewanella gelidimarina TaxID=56813 RepID=UPI00200EE166|nr:6-hydroxymethylpterin diphosphokinase MptE-like protein [Shewanella gelidimarina]MCL1057795.1 DUF115 domain-containing protein [Shewanella gelidimarina]